MNYMYPPQQLGYSPYKQPQYIQPQPSWNSPSQVRPVTSLEEVKAYPIEFDGSVFYFPDIANKVIYTKAINMDGTVAINTYELKELNTDQVVDYSYITREEFETSIKELKSMINLKPKETQPVTAQLQNEYKF